VLIHLRILAPRAKLCYLVGMDLGRLLLRLSVGGLMLFHGFYKIRHGIGGISGEVTAHHLPAAVAYLVYLGEVVAPLLVIVGWATRPAAVVIAINMVIAVWLSHIPQLFTLGKGGGYALELQALYFFGALAIAFIGTGRFAVMRGMGRWS
jgi:putative oxidoreductase